jgi:hypothetical protein
MGDATDMRMLWFYTLNTYNSFSIETGRSTVIDNVLKVKLVEYAFQSPFLMHCVMGLSAAHLQHLKQDVSPQRAVAYRARAFEGYRQAIQMAKPKDHPALLACSLLMTALSSQMFREPDGKPLYIIDWMQLWRGIGVIVELISPQSIVESGLAVLFYRPPMDLEKCSRYIPNNLLFMVTSIAPGDDDYEYQNIYYEALQYLGSLYMELEKGFSPILDLRVVTFFTFIPKSFIPLARDLRPRALILLAHYAAFAKLNQKIWWMDGIANREIPYICNMLGDEWEHLLRIPRKVTLTENKVEIATIIIDNHNWAPGEEDLYEKNRDPRIKTDLKLINDVGQEAMVVDGEWRLKPQGNNSGQASGPSYGLPPRDSALQDKAREADNPASAPSLDSEDEASICETTPSDFSYPSDVDNWYLLSQVEKKSRRLRPTAASLP